MRLRSSEVALVLREQRPRQHVPQQEHDPEHLVGLDPTGDDPLRELAGVRLQVLDAPGLQRVDVVVVDLGRLGEDLLVGHHAQQFGLADASGPLLAQVAAVLAQVRHELLQERVGVLGATPESSCGGSPGSSRDRLGSSADVPRSGSRSICSSSGLGWAECRVRSGATRLILRHRRRGPRARAPSRKRPVIVALMSSLPSGGVDMSMPTIEADERLRQTGARDVLADVARRPDRARRAGAAAATRLCSNRAGSDRRRSRARRTNASPTSTRARTARAMPSSGATSSMRADARRASRSRHRGPRQLVEQGVPVGEVAVDRGTGDPGRRRPRRSCSPGRPGAAKICAAPSRIAAATRC